MSILNRMTIQGVRSFGTDAGDEQLVKFDSPLTLILGENGCGKTTIIECIKYALTGELPPGADKGINFGHNPKVNKSATTQGQVKMKLTDPITERSLIISRSFKLSQEQKKMTFKSNDSTIHWEDKNGEKGSLSGRCVDITAEMIAAMGVAKPILSDVLFCHQEDSYWPLDEGKKLKEKFDAIFDATKYNKCMDILLKLRKSKETICKDTEKDVVLYKYKKDETASKRAILKDTETKFHDCTEKIVKFKEDLVPIEDRLRQINEVENNIISLKTEQKSIEIKMSNCKQQQEELLSNIKDVYQGDTESLQEKIESFHRTLSSKKLNLESSKTRYIKAEEKEKDCVKKITTAEVRKGELISIRGQEQELMASRNKKLNQMAQEMDVLIEDLDDCAEDASAATDAIKHKIKRMNQEFEQLSTGYDREDNKLQEKLNKLRDSQVSLKNDIKSKTTQMEGLEEDADGIKRQLDEIDKSASKLKDLANKIEVVSKEQEKLASQCNTDELRKQVASKIENRKALEINLEKIDKEMHNLQKQSGVRAELDIQKQLFADKNNETRKIKNKHSDSLYTLFGSSIPVTNFKAAVQKSYENFNTEVRDMTKMITKKEHECIALKSNREHQKDQLKSITDELNKCEEQVFEECQGQDFESELAKSQDNIEKNSKHRGTLLSSSFIYERYIETFERADPCCPLCHRNFDTQEEVGELSSELKMKLRKLPAEIEKAEVILKKDQKKYDNLLSLKPINEKIASIKQDLPVLKDKLKKTEISLQNTLSEVESLKMSLCEPQSNMELANSLIADMSMLDQNMAAMQRLQKEIDTLQAKLPEEDSEWTLQDAQSEQSVLKAELQQTRDDIENMQAKIAKHTEKMHDIREKKNKFIEEQLRLQSGVQARSQLSASYDKLQGQMAALSMSIDECKINLEPLQKLYEEALYLKTSTLEKNRAILKEKSNHISKCEKQLHDIQKDSESLQKLSAQNIANQVEEILLTLRNLYETRDEHAKAKQKIQQDINQLRDDITKHEIQERDLADNLALRQKQAEEENLVDAMKKLKNKMGDMDSRNILSEKSSLIQKHSNVCKSISEAKGQSMTLEENIKALKHELQTKYKDADKEYLERVYKLEVEKVMVKNLANYSLAMEWALMKYHEEKMTRINVLIKKMWREIYKGNDIDYIMIRTDEASGVTGKKRTYNYRVVQIKGGAEIDMRGRCSAGQKVLACLIIRMALAEIFSVNCGVIALDEPTTNLDRANIESLAVALAQLVESRSAQRNFMLIVISHDEEFIEVMSRVQELTKYHKVTRNCHGKSVITRIQIYNQ